MPEQSGKAQFFLGLGFLGRSCAPLRLGLGLLRALPLFGCGPGAYSLVVLVRSLVHLVCFGMFLVCSGAFLSYFLR